MRSTIAGQQAFPRGGALDASAVRELFDVLGAGTPQVLTGTADAISFPGTVIINSPGIDACTLAAPAKGPQPGGDDGKTLEIYNASGGAHSVTSSANGINVNKSVINFTGAIGNNVNLQAWNGTWLVMGTEKGVTFA